MKNKSGFFHLLPIILIGFIIAGAGFFWFSQQKVSNVTQSPTQKPSADGWKEYSNENLGFKIKYPTEFQRSGNTLQSYDDKNLPGTEIDLSDYISGYLKIDIIDYEFYETQEQLLTDINTTYEGNLQVCTTISNEEKLTNSQLEFIKIIQECRYPELKDWSNEFVVWGIYTKNNKPYFLTAYMPNLESNYNKVLDKILESFEFTK